MIAPIGRADERHQVEEGDNQGEDDRVGHAQDLQHGEAGDAGDQADRQIAGDVAGDRARRLVEDAPEARALRGGDEAQGRRNEALSVEEEEEGQQQDRDRGVDAPDDPDRHRDERADRCGQSRWQGG